MPSSTLHRRARRAPARLLLLWAGFSFHAALPCAADEPEQAPRESFSDAITVSELEEPRDDTLSAAVSQDLSEPDLTRLPGRSAAEAVTRLPGVVVVRDKGAADRVLVRGAESRLVSTTLDGERLPSPGGEERTAGIGLIPKELLEGIQVVKTFSPENDGDAVGGTVNLTTRRLGADGLTRIHLGAGYDSQSEGSLGDGSATWGRRYLDQRLGLLFSLASNRAERGADQVQRRFGDDGSLERSELRDFSLERSRLGSLLSVDATLDERSDVSLTGFYSRFSELEKRRRVKNDRADAVVLRELKDSELDRDILSLTAAGRHLRGGRLQIEARLSYLFAGQRQPDRIDTSFVQEDVEFAAGGSRSLVAVNEDLDLLRLDEIGLEDNRTEEHNLVAAFDLAAPVWITSGDSLELRAGLKLRRKDKEQDTTTTLFGTDRDIFLRDFLDPSESARVGGVLLGPMVDPELARLLIPRFDLTGYLSLEEEAGDYTAAETTAAAYGLGEVDFGARIRLLAGWRYEWTRSDYTGFELTSGDEDDGTLAAVREVRGASERAVALPMASMAVTLGGSWTLRAAAARTLARPNYYDLVPFNLIDQEDLEIRRGNPELETTRAWNFDLALDGRFGQAGSLTLGAFSKSLDDFIYERRGTVVSEGQEFEVTRPENGGAAELYGFEVRVGQLVPWGSGDLSYELNFTRTSSGAELDGRQADRVRLPGQSELSGSLELGYETRKVSVALLAGYVGAYLVELGASPAEDVFVGDQLRWDLTASVTLAPSWRLSLSAANLTDEPHRLYRGSRRYPMEEEAVGSSIFLGLRWHPER